MSKGSLKGLVLALAFAFAVVASTDAEVKTGSPAYRRGRVLIMPKPGAQGRLSKLRQARHHEIGRHFEDLGVEVVEIPLTTDPRVAAKNYLDSGLVEFAEPDYRIHASELPDDPGLNNCWGLNNTGQSGGKAQADIRAALAWNSHNSAEDVIVAVIDSGVRYTHEDLAPNMWRNPKETPNGKDDDGDGIVDDIYGYDAFGGTGDPMDDCGHGTHVAGTIGAVGNNGTGVAGVCWKVKIMALKFMASDGWGDTSDAIACINYARKHGAGVINASWGSSENSYALRNAINAARNAGIIFVTAAGNELENNDLVPSYPANINLDNIVSVAAVNRYGALDTSYSNWGRTSVDLAAPGTEIYSTSYRGDHEYEWMSGTSMATPHVTGGIALLRAAYPDETYSSIISRLYGAVDKLPSLKDKCVTEGALNIGNLFPHRWAVSANSAGDGTVTLSTNGGTYLEGTSLEVLAIPDPGYSFQGWSGDLEGTANPASVLVDADKHIMANFVKTGGTSGGSALPPLISKIAMQTDGTLRLDFANASAPPVLETSTNLLDWEPVAGPPPGSTGAILPATVEPRRFYRARTP